MTKIRNKLLLAFILISLIPLVVLGGYGLITIRDSLQTASIKQVEEKVNGIGRNIEGFLKHVSDDLFFLRDSPALLMVAGKDTAENSSGPRAIEQLQQEFLAFSKHKKIYYQVRFLDADGMEVVRVDRIGGESIVVPENKLQNKKGRYYFADTAKLDEGKLMISPLDLNRERGEVERPLRPVIRYGTPVYGSNNQLMGIVLFNVNADAFLKILKEHEGEHGSHEPLFFIDPKGFYYTNTDRKKEWGGPADLDTGFNFKKDYPELAEKIIDTWKPMTLSQGEYIVAEAPVFLDTQKRNKLGSIVHMVEKSSVFASANSFRNIMLMIGGVVFLITLFLAVTLARSITTPLVYLTEATQKMSKGNLSEPVSVSTKDETKLLAESIDRLRKSMVILLKRKK